LIDSNCPQFSGFAHAALHVYVAQPRWLHSAFPKSLTLPGWPIYVARFPAARLWLKDESIEGSANLPGPDVIAAEIVEDLYLGLRAGGALRKQRRGEPLSAEEQEALGRWRQMSAWRKAIAIGAFSLGTFGLGFTLGGLIFGKWRRA